MYNGIGLTSVRGSGTSGHVQKNMAHVSRDRMARRKGADQPRQLDGRPKVTAAANAEIIEHNRRREVEVKVFALRESLEEIGTPEEQVEASCDRLRQEMLAKMQTSAPPTVGPGSSRGMRAGETHEEAMQKERETAAIKSALKVSDDYVAGSAFDRELQEKKKAERIAKREAEEQARLEEEEERAREIARAEEELEREREREERRKRKEARREEKEARRKEKKRRRHERDDDRGRRSPSGSGSDDDRRR